MRVRAAHHRQMRSNRRRQNVQSLAVEIDWWARPAAGSRGSTRKQSGQCQLLLLADPLSRSSEVTGLSASNPHAANSRGGCRNRGRYGQKASMRAPYRRDLRLRVVGCGSQTGSRGVVQSSPAQRDVQTEELAYLLSRQCLQRPGSAEGTTTAIPGRVQVTLPDRISATPCRRCSPAGGFAGAVRAEQGDSLARTDGKLMTSLSRSRKPLADSKV